MITSAVTTDWRQAPRRSAHEAILDAAWALVGEEGLAGLALRDLAHRAGITTPTVYSYFDSKSAIYDAMFGQAAAAVRRRDNRTLRLRRTSRSLLVASVRRLFFEFCTCDPARYQLLFQRTLPGFEPSTESLCAGGPRPGPEPRNFWPLNGSPKPDTSTCGLR